ncbi:tissue factor pathway inhibitor isoform X1 [Cygnus atratus]|uniref:tissue factor pathway inhibitor isoform X1 n=1 Tax=Cygnus atratus TaxID=8868 RepID=UPI0015D5A254|nr:tissue factor pathway inhibitor isoform X1 [Cygnus atratus]XP_035425173.1 tissue factor pathway inhibitor isoform X1 [Cygnus atratus]XP_035425182.1 tissue factor pathway inhibitor isoform X1 [Cygnus atratus]XP_035425189.1 tissue factor pathway inhibitor isoform X1 [Cygnus atratus]XP_035425196.1 tissue factor pathway inhibitor isoform X1 [Cygnus atratus]XP_050567538.1 tissue factor pathway inhibitor isoform X1 [Cygnus atratus]XP_050567539.1 tissue factor pathway inhibitor isoform X1 [Cygnus
MKGRKRGCFLPLTFFMLFVCIAGHVTDDSDDGEEEDVLGASLPPLKLGHSICALKADEGPCKAIHMRYYFNIQSRECEMFEYGGCHGNENNFLTLEECQNKCVVTEFSLKMMLAKMKQEKPDFCFHEKDPGTCRGFFSRYFYNKESKLCEIFKYGGCLGNQNNFKSLEECQTTCQGDSNLLPDAPTEDHLNIMNSSSPEEEHNQFPRIFVNLLPTAPNEKSNIMNSSYPEEEHKQFPRFFEPPAIPSLCMTPMDKGLCRAKETRFFYNYSTGRCRPFNYSGCGGNENNFTSRKSCLRICKKGFIKNKGERRVIKIKKKKKKLTVKVLEEESIPERIHL